MRGEGRVAFLNLHHKAPDMLSPGIRARMGRTDDLLLRKALDDAALLRIAFDKHGRAVRRRADAGRDRRRAGRAALMRATRSSTACGRCCTCRACRCP